MIRFVFRWAFRFVLLAIVLAIGLLLLKDNMARSVAEQRIRQETGFEAKIGKLELGVFAPTVKLENFVLYNPAVFGGSAFLDIPELHVEYNPRKLPLEGIHVRLIRLKVAELHIVENNEGRTNIMDLLHKIAPNAIASKGNTNEGLFSGIDMLNLSVGKVRYTNMRRPKRDQSINVRMENELIQNLRSEEDLAAVLFRVLLRAGIPIYYDTPKAAQQASTTVLRQ